MLRHASLLVGGFRDMVQLAQGEGAWLALLTAPLLPLPSALVVAFKAAGPPRAP